MITLKLRQKGFFVELPGVTPFRTPAEVDITHIKIPVVVTTLHSIGIEKFEIVSDTPGKESIINEKNFKDPKNDDKVVNRIDNLEKMIGKLIRKQDGHTPINKEQINNKLEKIESLSQAILKKSGNYSPEKNEPAVEELDAFIPEIDLESIELKGSTGKTVIKKDQDDTDESADLLSSLTGGKNK